MAKGMDILDDLDRVPGEEVAGDADIPGISNAETDMDAAIALDRKLTGGLGLSGEPGSEEVVEAAIFRYDPEDDLFEDS